MTSGGGNKVGQISKTTDSETLATRLTPDSQANLRVSEPSDPFEREADRMAERVRRIAAPDGPFDGAADSTSGASGGPLDPVTRIWADHAFGADFSDVRVHTDASAARSAQHLVADAYTLGSDIVFGESEYRPHTAEGRHLLAHELAHVVQQKGSGDGRIYRRTQPGQPVSPTSLIEPVADALSGMTAVQFRDWWGSVALHLMMPATPVQETVLTLAFPGLFDPELITRLGNVQAPERSILIDGARAAMKHRVRRLLADRLTLALNAFAGLQYKNWWPEVSSQLTDPKPLPSKKKRSAAQNAFSPVWEPPLLDELHAILDSDRPWLVSAVEGAIVERVAGAPSAEVMAEYDQLDQSVQKRIERGRRGYVAARLALFERFGSVEGINQYYAQIKSIKFLGDWVSVHPVMEARLAAAESLLNNTHAANGQTWAEIAKASMKNAGGLSIRENRNNTSQLSDHSFGWAIDIDASTNPNTKRAVFNASPVEELTGLDLFGGPEFTKIRAGGTAAELLGSIETMREASKEYEAAFDSQAALTDALAAYLRRQGLLAQDWMKDDLWPTLDQAKTKRKRSARIEVLSSWIQYIWHTRDEEEPFSIDEPIPPDYCPDPAMQPQEEFPDFICDPVDLPSDVVRAVAETLYNARIAFDASTYKGKEVKPSALGSVGRIAQHGFLDLAPVLVAALRGSDGGNLVWLGVARHTKDFMHFELPKADRPTIVKVAPGGDKAGPADADLEQ
ncbi:MAG: DUF4157 domain-containing protein [Acidimicrobiales bacterium]